MINIAVVGVGNCASAFIQGIHYYGNRSSEDAVGLMNWDIGGHRPHDISVVAAFDIDRRKVGKDLSEAVFATPNCILVPVGTSAGSAADELGRRHGLGIDEPIPPDRIALVGAAIEQSVIEGHRHDALLLRDAQRTISVGTPDGRTIVLLDAAVTIPTRVGTPSTATRTAATCCWTNARSSDPSRSTRRTSRSSSTSMPTTSFTSTSSTTPAVRWFGARRTSSPRCCDEPQPAVADRARFSR